MNTEQNKKDASELEKNKGNQFFKNGHYQQAIDCYSSAIILDRNNYLLYGNRSQAYLNLNMPAEAEIDCNQAISLNPSYIKGYHRRGLARKLKCQYKLALEDFNKVLCLDRNNQQALNEVIEINKVLKNHKPIPVKAIYKSELTRCQDTLLDIKVDQPCDIQAMEVVTSQCPDVIPINSFQFYNEWRELSDESKYKYLNMIGPQQIAKIFKNSIEPLVFCDILRILQNFENITFNYQLLSNLTSIDRFKSLTLFLEENEKNILRNLFNKMKFDNCINQNDLNCLIRLYCLQPVIN